MGRILPLIVLVLAPVSVSADDSWSGDPKRERPGARQENRIIRWCADEGNHERYASANIQLKGYRPCGELTMPVSCDPSGKRMIGSSGEVPYAYKDCSIGPRIVVQPSGLEAKESYQDDAAVDPDPLSSRERADLAGEIKRAKEQQATSMDVQLQQALGQLMENLIAIQGYDPITGNKRGGRKAPSKQRRFSDQQIDEMIRYVDPKFQSRLEQILRSQ